MLHFGPTPPPVEDSDAWYAYRGKAFATGVVALLKRYHPAEMAPPRKGDDDECSYSDPEVWDFPGWALTAKGLWLGAYFARVERACDAPDWAVIPWSALSLSHKTEPELARIADCRRSAVGEQSSGAERLSWVDSVRNLSLRAGRSGACIPASCLFPRTAIRAVGRQSVTSLLIGFCSNAGRVQPAISTPSYPLSMAGSGIGI